MRTKHNNVPDLIHDMEPWVNEVTLLREIILCTGLDEGIKWGVPIYMHEGNNVVGISAFKSYVGMWFHQGVFLSDPKKVLINAQEGKTKALRQWRFQSKEEIKPALIKKYIKEAIQIAKEGKKIQPVKQKIVDMPEEFTTAFKKDKKLKAGFDQLTPGRQREYLEYVGEAKAIATRLRRLEKCIPMILAGKGLNDRYK